MHRLFDDSGNLLARIGPDRFDGGAGLAEHDLALALALDKDGLLDANRSILPFGPAVGFAASCRIGASDIWSSG